MSKYIDEKLSEFREKFKHSQFVDYAGIESFLKSALEEQEKETIKRVEKILMNSISIDSLKTKQELDEVYRKLEILKGQTN